MYWLIVGQFKSSLAQKGMQSFIVSNILFSIVFNIFDVLEKVYLANFVTQLFILIYFFFLISLSLYNKYKKQSIYI